MSDVRLRQAQRHANDDPARYLAERLRSGKVTREAIELAAFCGDKVARSFDPQNWAFEPLTYKPIPRWAAEFFNLAEPLGDKVFNVACYHRVHDGAGWTLGVVCPDCDGTGRRTITVPWSQWLAVLGCVAVARACAPYVTTAAGVVAAGHALDAAAKWLKEPTKANRGAWRTALWASLDNARWVPYCPSGAMGDDWERSTSELWAEWIRYRLESATRRLSSAREMFGQAVATAVLT